MLGVDRDKDESWIRADLRRRKAKARSSSCLGIRKWLDPGTNGDDHTCWSRACVNVNHLRIAEHEQNGRNLSGAHSRSKLGVRNVRKKGNRYQVSVGKTYIGSFKTLDEAKSVAEKERVARYGEFAGRG